MKPPQLKKETLLLAVCVSILLHNLEEGLFMQEWIAANVEELPSPIKHFIAEKVTINFYKKNFIPALYITTVALWAVALLTYVKHFKPMALNLMILISWIFILNAIQHTGLSIFLNRYTPGVVTAITLCIPVNYFFLRKLVIERVVAKRQLYILFALSIPLYLAFIAIALLAFR